MTFYASTLCPTCSVCILLMMSQLTTEHIMIMVWAREKWYLTHQLAILFTVSCVRKYDTRHTTKTQKTGMHIRDLMTRPQGWAVGHLLWVVEYFEEKDCDVWSIKSVLCSNTVQSFCNIWSIFFEILEMVNFLYNTRRLIALPLGCVIFGVESVICMTQLSLLYAASCLVITNSL